MCSLAVYDFLHLTLDIACFAVPEFSATYRNGLFLNSIPIVIPITQVRKRLIVSKERAADLHCRAFRVQPPDSNDP